MKNLLLPVLLVTFFGSVAGFSYDIKIINNTDSAMTVTVTYGGAGVCNPDTWNLPAKGEIKHGVGGCCAESGVKFTATTGPLRGKELYYDPPRTGFGLSCRSWIAEATQSGDIFVVETR